MRLDTPGASSVTPGDPALCLTNGDIQALTVAPLPALITQIQTAALPVGVIARGPPPAQVPLQNFVGPLTTNPTSHSLLSQLPEVEEAIILAVVNHTLKPSELYKLDSKYRGKAEWGMLELDGSFASSRTPSPRTTYLTPYSIEASFTVYIRILVAHVSVQQVAAVAKAAMLYLALFLRLHTEYEWPAVLNYHMAPFARRRREVAAGDYSGWPAVGVGLCADHLNGFRKPQPPTTSTATSSSHKVASPTRATEEHSGLTDAYTGALARRLGKEQTMEPVPAIYIPVPAPFPVLETFIEETVETYNLDLFRCFSPSEPHVESVTPNTTAAAARYLTPKQATHMLPGKPWVQKACDKHSKLTNAGRGSSALTRSSTGPTIRSGRSCGNLTCRIAAYTMKIESTSTSSSPNAPPSALSIISPGTALTSVMSTTHDMPSPPEKDMLSPTGVLSSFMTSIHSLPHGNTHPASPTTPDVWKMTGILEPRYRPAYELEDGNLERSGRGLTVSSVYAGA
ncbi:hypothetical protein DXG01_008956 [Tephrocybe rancida]|nr:hypothetical protein DXG01_008956 [Tephrocybe rancida]